MRTHVNLPSAVLLLMVPALIVTGVVVTSRHADSTVDLQHAIEEVRSHYFRHDFHHGAVAGEAARARWPKSSELRAWTLANQAGRGTNRWSGSAEEAVARAEAWVTDRPGDVWAAIALAVTLNHDVVRRREALAASSRAMELSPAMPEALWVRAHTLSNLLRSADALALVDERWPVEDQTWPELLNIQGKVYLAVPERRAEGLDILARVRKEHPDNVNAHFMAGAALWWDRNHMSEGVDLLERAAMLSPASLEISRVRWHAIARDPRLDAEQKKAAIDASASELLEHLDDFPDAIATIALNLSGVGLQLGDEDLRHRGAQLEDRVLAEFDDTEAAEGVLWARWERQAFRLTNGEMFGAVEDTAAFNMELSNMLWSFIERPHHRRSSILGAAHRALFDHLRYDDAVSADTLLILARGAAGLGQGLPHARLAAGLADRGVHLDAARDIALDGISSTEAFVRTLLYDGPGEELEDLNRWMANGYSALGYVELKAGDLSAAREALDRALDLSPSGSLVQYRAGLLAEAEGEIETAEVHFLMGERSERMNWGQDRPNRAALERLYGERQADGITYDEFVAAVDERDRAQRWQRVADTRLETPRPLPAIELAWLDGGRIGADALGGRIAVINFWGTWCPPCIAEAPDIQRLHERYRDDDGVVFLTINAYDLDLTRVERWMTENEYDFPVLVDDDFAVRNGVRAFPTTWFADANGRIIFEYRGIGGSVYDEFVWRIELLQQGERVVATAEADGSG